MSKQCHICATTLTGLQRKYCSDDCYKKNLYSKLKEQRIKRRVEPETYTTCHWHNCENEFEPQRSKFCSPECRNKNAVTKTRRNNKSKLVQHFGGECQRCGYNKSQAALQFHHTEDNKEFSLGHKGKTISYERLLAEAEKCELICANCHALHHVKEKEANRDFTQKRNSSELCHWHLCHSLIGTRKSRFCSEGCSTKERIQNKRTERKKEFSYLLGGKCLDCGYSENIKVLHFHHREESTKVFEIGRSLHYSRDKLMSELKKCDLICGNCHAERHAKQNLT